MYKKVLRSVRFALNGLWVTWKEELNFKIEVIVSLALLFCVFYFRFTLAEAGLVFIAITIVLTSELLNTAIENLSDKVEPEEDPLIGKVKDISSAFVLVSATGSAVLILSTFVTHFN